MWMYKTYRGPNMGYGMIKLSQSKALWELDRRTSISS